MKQQKVDRRVRYTKAMLREAMLEQMLQKPVGKITVTDICREADINRNTFYAHYASVEELLRGIEDEVYEKISQSITNLQTDDSLTAICRLIHEDKHLFRVLFSDNNDNRFVKRVLQLVYETTIYVWNENMSNASFSEANVLLLYEYIINGGMAVIKRWIRGDIHLQPEQVATLIITVTNHGLTPFAVAGGMP